jgi:hypothetical protein
MLVITARVKVVVVMVSALALAAGLLTLTLLSKPAQAQAQTSIDIERTPFSDFVSGCSGEEYFLLEGTLKTVAHTTMDASGGFHTKFQFHLWGQGEGLSSGDKYVFNDIANSNIIRSPTGADLIATEAQTFKITRQGSVMTTDDFQAIAVVHFTINAQGELTAEVHHFEQVCT